MKYIKLFLKTLKEENDKKWTKKDYLVIVVCCILGFFSSDIKEFILSLFN
tara:strand:+ start:179 stop:328 length:150 start_codon:yes stop_codon:yes gene_type:complete